MTDPIPIATLARTKHRKPHSTGNKRESRPRWIKKSKATSISDDAISNPEQQKVISTKSNEKAISQNCSSRRTKKKRVAFCSFTETYDEGHIVPRLNQSKGFFNRALESLTQTKTQIETQSNTFSEVLDITPPKMAIRTIKKLRARMEIDNSLSDKNRPQSAKLTYINSERSIPRTQSKPVQVYKNVVQGQGPGNEDIVLIHKLGENKPSQKPRTISKQSLNRAPPQSYPHMLVNHKVRAQKPKNAHNKPQTPPKSASPEQTSIPVTISKNFISEGACETKQMSPRQIKVKLASDGVRYKGIRTIKPAGQKSQKESFRRPQ